MPTGTPVPGSPGPAGFGPPPGLPASPGAAVPGAAPTAVSGAVPPGVPAGVHPGGAAGGRSGGNLRRNAVWAFVGAVLASAGWTTAVLVIPGLVSSGGGKSAPRSLGSYHTSDNFCVTAKPENLLKTYNTSDTSSPTHHTDQNPALDSMTCSMSLKRIGDTTSSGEYASAYMRGDLHKAVNPAPEFSAAKEVYRARGYQISDIPGLGEEAYFIYKDDPGTSDKTWHTVSAEVDVRDGGMTYYISWNGSYTDGKSKVPSKEDLRTALQADTWEAVRSMRK
ncbi:hypothetical protein ACH4E7_20155 [Kitasatospora sp. NPDC018058]|uniref:hypothetical protein n=1 Tax=Kitasatospora sp. NPDC018058 TaxID=3364025 RepID=UPI0037C0A1AE